MPPLKINLHTDGGNDKKTESGTGLDSLTECLNQISKHTFPTSYSPRRVLFTTKVITVGQISISLSLKQGSSKQEGDPPRPQLSCWWHLDHTDSVITCSDSLRNLGVGSPALHRSRTLNVRLGQVVSGKVMNLENVMLSEISQMQQDNHIWSHLDVEPKKSHLYN